MFTSQLFWTRRPPVGAGCLTGCGARRGRFRRARYRAGLHGLWCRL